MAIEKATPKPRTVRAQTVKDRLLAERIMFGGMVYTRREVMLIMQAEKQDGRAVDYFTFHPAALPDDTPLDDLLPSDAALIGERDV